MSLTYCFEMPHISLETDWWVLFNASLTVRICSAIHEICADEAFTATDGLISQSFVVAFVHLAYVWIALIWGFTAQLSLWKSVHWLWRYKLNEVCDNLNTNNFIFLFFYFFDFILIFFSCFFYFSFGKWRGTWHCSHMTCHMMWYHKPRIW